MKHRIAIAAAALTLSLIPLSAQAAEYNAYGAVCNAPGQSSFTAVKRGYYSYLWRDGYSVLGAGLVYLRAGDSISRTTPGGAGNATRFGVLTSSSSTYAYVTCNYGG